MLGSYADEDDEWDAAWDEWDVLGRLIARRRPYDQDKEPGHDRPVPESHDHDDD